ncbi:hypothetical protein L917_14757, partial [Phytophthora nicotianae]
DGSDSESSKRREVDREPQGVPVRRLGGPGCWRSASLQQNRERLRRRRRWTAPLLSTRRKRRRRTGPLGEAGGAGRPATRRTAPLPHESGRRASRGRTIATADLQIWHAFIGMPGSNNDINVLHASPL